MKGILLCSLVYNYTNLICHGDSDGKARNTPIPGVVLMNPVKVVKINSESKRNPAQGHNSCHKIVSVGVDKIVESNANLEYKGKQNLNKSTYLCR